MSLHDDMMLIDISNFRLIVTVPKYNGVQMCNGEGAAQQSQ